MTLQEDHEHSWQNVWRCRHCGLVEPPAARSGSAAQNHEEMGVAGVQRVYAALARSPQGVPARDA